MDDTPAKENPAKDFNKLDLTQLQGFSFGTQWTQDKASPADARDRSDRPRRDHSPDRREGPGSPERRDRRTFRKPALTETGGGQPAGPGGPSSPGAGDAPRREYSGDRGPRREYQGGGQRREYGGQRYGQSGYGDRREHVERGPYESPFFNIAFYPEDTSFNALAKTIRSSCRTIELFEIARTVIGKSDRFVVVLTRKAAEAPRESVSAPATAPAARTEATASRSVVYLSAPDGMPFETEEAALAHVFSNHLARFFELAEVEVEPPKGNFQVINKCGVTGELLGPPNYHRYAQIVQQHYSAKITRMPFDVFRSRIETVRDPEVVAQWLEKMKKTTRYTWKQSAKPAAAPAPTVATEPATPATAEAIAETSAQEGTTTPETAPAITFDTFEDARTYLLSNARDKVVRAVETARFHGKLLEAMPQGEIRRGIEGALERQRRFPLDTANALRGRLRREHFTIFKKGSKGVSYVCAVKRKFRVPGQTFAESISALIAYIESNPMVRASELPVKFLQIDPAVLKAVEPSATPDAKPAESAEAAAAPTAQLTIEQRAKISRMQGDLRWLVTEGYVTEFIDGRLFAPPPMVEARKKEVESEEHDPENFPEAPPTPAPESTASPVAAEAAPSADPVPESVMTAPPVAEVTHPETAPSEPTAPAAAPVPPANS
jgi:hypothetical protein